jgi:gliding motility-associated-like protein
MKDFNVETFSPRKHSSEFETRVFNKGEYLNHPELGQLPFNVPPCINCVEVFEKREADYRYFIKPNSGEFHIQKSYGAINYRDENGWWREINHRLEKKSEWIFTAINQPHPVYVDLKNKSVTLKHHDKIITSALPELFHEKDNDIKSIGRPEINFYTAGDDGLKISEYYKDIDLFITVRQGQFEFSFIINKNLNLKSGQLILKQKLSLGDGLQLREDKPSSAGTHQQIFITKNNVPYFIIEKGFAFDNDQEAIPHFINSRIVDSEAEFLIPVSWLNDPTTDYPVLIDPVITTQNTTPVASIGGTKFSPVCWTNSCDYSMTVATPANSTIIGMAHSFQYNATGLCFAQDGGYSLEYNGCFAPSGFPGVYTLPSPTPGFFTIDSIDIPEFIPCFPSPQCASQNLNFTLHFYRCNNDPDTTCASNCIRATQPWIMFVSGSTLEINSITTSQQICAGSTAEIIVNPRYGVPPYNYFWTQGAPAADTIQVSPANTTTYTVTITDACGQTTSDSSVVTVLTNNNPGFTISQNPACENDLITLNGNAGGAATDYDWIVPGSSAPGGTISDNQSPQVSYNFAGVYDIILSYGNTSCNFNDTVTVTIDPFSAPSVSIIAQPSGSVCQGDTVVFYATPVNGGVNPAYDWLVDGLVIQSGVVDSFITSTFNNGSIVQAILHSNSACASPLTDTASLFMVIGSALTPQVIITPDTAVCSGSSITLNATGTNGGTSPAYQWYSNGVLVAGATSSSYTFNVIPPDTVISVEMISSLTCVTGNAAYDTSIVNILQNLQPSVTITAMPTGIVCAGDSVQYTAHAVNGGVPTYQWHVNGIISSNTDSIFTLAPLNNDSISVIMNTSLTCAAAVSDDDYIITIVSPSVSPAVAITLPTTPQICLGDTVDFHATAINAGSSPVYSWFVNGISSGNNDSIFTTSLLNNNDEVTIIVTSSLSCAPVASDSAAVLMSVVSNVSPLVNINAGQGLCEGDTIQFIAEATNGGGNPVYQWMVNGIANGMTDDTISISTLQSGDSVTVSMVSSLGCVSTPVANSSPFISALQPLDTAEIALAITPGDSICIGQQAVINATLQNGGASPQISWYLNGILSANNMTTFTTGNFVQGDIVVASMISNAACLMIDTDTSNFVRIFFYQPLGVQLQPGQLLCPGDTTTLTAIANGGNGNYHYIWSDGNSDSSTVEIIPGRNTQIIVTVTDNCSFTPAADTINVPVLTGPVAEFSYYNASPGSFYNTVQFINQSIDADNLLWTFPDSTTTTDLNPVYQFPDEGQYDIKLFTSNNSGCFDSIIYTIEVREEEAIYYPNSFSPNGDGMNEFFTPMGASLEDYELTIWDRWGEMIYIGNRLTAWDGRVKDSKKPAPEGVYVFRLDLLNDNFEKRIITGRVTLIR